MPTSVLKAEEVRIETKSGSSSLSLSSGTTSPLVTEAEKAYFQKSGFVALQRITSQEDVASIRATIESLFKTKTGYRQGARFNLVEADDAADDIGIPQIVGPRHYASTLRKSEFFQNAAIVARELLGPDVRFTGDHTLVKPPRVGSPSPWHQDMAFRNPQFEYNEISFWMPLQAVNKINGCMEYIPGSQLGKILPHRSLNNDAKIHSLECHDGFDPAQTVACPMPAGGCAIHSGRTLHYAGPNQSDQPRYAYVLVFAIPPVPAKNPQEFPWLEGKDTGRLRRMKSWMRRGGLFVSLWRFFREADLRDLGPVLAKLRMQTAVFASLWRNKKHK